ncbi:hypothetical protein Godav_000930 [Gossypium davidsonii]|uniref:Uncharacterized protein n=1 Tax=Gossypium davidsonii TaxID=34287 RepID=A0A7J8T199_GOSDV|nr:hypothetical protein [Gossypium davidsonii]
MAPFKFKERDRPIISTHARTDTDGFSTNAHTTPIQYLPSYSGWTVGHPSLMFYTLGPFHFPMTLTSPPLTMYRPSTY